MWLENLKELKKASGLSTRQIVETTKLPERTVSRIFSGDTANPSVDTLSRIVTALGGSLDDILADSNAVVGSKGLAKLQEEIDRLRSENALLTAENVLLQDKVASSSAEIDLLRLKLAHKEELLHVHECYKTVLSSIAKGYQDGKLL